jgi:Fe-S-cluster containining protein
VPDPGLEGVRPFRFRCRRSGNCCTVPGGYVWVEDDECGPMADALGLDRVEFRASRTRQVVDPSTGALRLALRDDARGRCALLEGANHCTVYAARPEHCRAFPYWKSVLTDAGAFERARAVCPGIEPVVDDETRTRAFAALEALYEEVDAFIARAQPVCIARGLCCRFEEAGHRLYATALEADYAVAQHPTAPEPEAPGRCPYHVGGRCTARVGRPLGCRTYFCDTRMESVMQEAHEHFLARLRAIDYPPTYAEFTTLVAARGVGASGRSVTGDDPATPSDA